MTTERVVSEAVEEGRRGIEMSDAYKRPWSEPASSCELSKAAVNAALPHLRQSIEEEVRERLRDHLYHGLDMRAELDEPTTERVGVALDTAIDSFYISPSTTDPEGEK